MKQTLCLSLISHTNIGKTTLARTLLRQDVGVVADRAHVTTSADAWTLVDTSRATLKLWDTPGFGDTRKLLARLRSEASPLSWFLREVWDRTVDRDFYFAQLALRNVCTEAHVIVYLVDGTQHPDREASFVHAEMELLAWTERPVVLLINQTGPQADAWHAFAARYPIIRGVLSLDAHTRCWVEEVALMQELVPHFPEPLRPHMADIALAWAGQLTEQFTRSMTCLADHIATAAADAQSGARLHPKKAVAALRGRLDTSTRAFGAELIAVHQLEGGAAVDVQASLDEVIGPIHFSVPKTAIASAVFGAAVGGAAASAATGGFDGGTGAIIGLGVGTGAGWLLAKGVNSFGSDVARWSDDYLRQVVIRACLLYIGVAHFGRGRGAFSESQDVSAWRGKIERALGDTGRLARTWQRRDAIDRPALQRLLTETVQAVLTEQYPRARELWKP